MVVVVVVVARPRETTRSRLTGARPTDLICRTWKTCGAKNRRKRKGTTRTRKGTFGAGILSSEAESTTRKVMMMMMMMMMMKMMKSRLIGRRQRWRALRSSKRS